MKLTRFFLISLLISLFVSEVYSQGTMLYLNGKTKRFMTAEVKGDFLIYRPEGPHKDGIRKMEKFDIFSLQFDDGTEQIIYEPDTTYGDPSVEEAREYVKGEQLADSIYKKPMNLIGGIASGAAGSILVFYAPIVPAVYATTISLFTPHMPKSQLEKEVRSEDFIAGYERKARNKKTKSALLGGVIGLGVGLSILAVIQ